MEIRRAAEVLLRAQSTPLTILLKPSTTPRWLTTRQLSSKSNPTTHPRTTKRTLTTTSAQNAIRPSITTTSTPPPSTPENPPPKTTDQDLDELSQTLNWAAQPTRTPIGRTFSSPANERTFNNGHTTQEIMSSFRASQRARGLAPPIDTTKMLDPTGSSMAAMQSVKQEVIGKRLAREPLKLNPALGKTMELQKDIDLGRAIRLVEQLCSRNGVKHQANTQRFHERPGLKRKRLRMVRWRKRFGEGFKATVLRVKQLRNQGW